MPSNNGRPMPRPPWWPWEWPEDPMLQDSYLRNAPTRAYVQLFKTKKAGK